MQTLSWRRLGAILALAGSLVAPAAYSQLVPAGITGTGTYFNSPSNIIDGFVPAEMTGWTDAVNTYWDWQTPVSFTIDLGGTFALYDALLSVDNNDDYRLEYSLDGSTYNTLLYITAAMGEIPVNPGGIDTFASNSGHPEYDAGIAFSVTNARYLRVSALNGDGLYSVGEVQVWGREVAGAVPEPSTYGLIGAGALAALVALKRRRA